MQSYSSFIFDSFDFDSKRKEIALRYCLDDDLAFTETLHLPKDWECDEENRENALHALHLAGGVSYYKTCLPKNIEVRTSPLTKDQAQFWNTVYENGLGEFFYRNEVDFRGLIQFPAGARTSPDIHASAPSSRTLVPIGGGKDSVVTIETLQERGEDITLLRMGSHPLIDAMVESMDLPCITVERTLDPMLFTLNKQGALNGHIPITAYLSCLSVLLCKLYGFSKVAMSNEKSANVGNTEYLGKEINHQWSKSDEFETMFQAYVRDYIDPGLTYESTLRSMTELRIVKEFSTYPQYFPLFSSCNKNWKIARENDRERWCSQCPKCAFAFTLFAAYNDRETVLSTFGSNIFENADMIPLFRELLGLEGFKPFECVGTAEETNEAFSMIKERGEFDDTPIMKLYVDAL